MRVGVIITLMLVAVTLACGRRTFVPPMVHTASQAPVATPEPWSLPTPKPIPEVWTESELQSEIFGCVQTASFQQKLNADELRNTMAACRCVFEVASRKWSYTTYRSYPNYYLSELERTGVVQQCSARL